VMLNLLRQRAPLMIVPQLRVNGLRITRR